MRTAAFIGGVALLAGQSAAFFAPAGLTAVNHRHSQLAALEANPEAPALPQGNAPEPSDEDREGIINSKMMEELTKRLKDPDFARLTTPPNMLENMRQLGADAPHKK